MEAIRTYKDYAHEEKVYLYAGESATGTPVWTLFGRTADSNKVITTEFCVVAGTYALKLVDDIWDGWSTGSKLELSIGGSSIGSYHLLSGNSKVEVVSLTASSNHWLYSNQPQSTTAWTTDPVSWESMSSFPAVTTVTRYFRKSFFVPPTPHAYGIVISVKTDCGFIAYLNGQRVSDWAMPSSSITSSTLATESTETPVLRTRSALLGYYGAIGDEIEIAIEIHAAVASPSGSECFEASVTFITGSENRRIDTDGTSSASHQPTGTEGAVCLYDGNVSTKWCFLAIDPNPWSYWQWNNGRREMINRYKITTANDEAPRDPTHWKIYGTNNVGDPTSWRLLDEQSNVFWGYGRYQTKTFDMNNNVAYNAYKIEILGQAGDDAFIQFAEFNLLMFDQDISIPFISYPRQAYSIIKELETVQIAPQQTSFSNWQITPSLPSGLLFNSATGVISGVASVDSVSTVYTVTAVYADQQTYSTTISITVTSCELPNSVFVVVTKTNPDEVAESFDITNSAGEVVASSSSSYCLPVGMYTVTMRSTTGSTWKTGSLLTVKARINYEEVVLEQSRLNKDGSDSFSLSLVFPIPPVALNNIKYLADGSIPSDWMSPSFSPSWSVLQDSQRPETSQKRQFFHTTFTVTDKSSYQSFELQVKAKNGVLVYLNGEELYRVYLPSGNLTTTTEAEGGKQTVYWRSINGRMSLLKEGSNTLTIAIVNMGTSSTPIAFDMMMRLVASSSQLPRYWSSGAQERDLFDNNPKTEMSLAKTTTEVVVSLQFSDNSAYMINKYCFVTSTANMVQDPKAWSVYGSMNDGVSYTMLSSESNIYFDSRSSSTCFFIPSNKAAYNIYMIKFTHLRDDTASFLSLADINLLVENLESADVPALAFIPSTIVGYTGAALPEVPANSEYYSDFKITPALPQGLSLNTNTGAIRGVVASPMSATTYTISAMNHLGERKETTITLTVQICGEENISFTLELKLYSGASRCSFELIDQSTGDIVEMRNKLVDYSSFTIPMCRKATVYTLKLKHTTTDGWGNNKINVKLADGTTLLSESLASGVTQKEYQFNPAYVIPPHYATWSYYVDEADAPSNWNTAVEATQGWSSAMPGDFRSASTVTQYYVKTFTVDDITHFSSLDIVVVVKAGAIVYLNGQEIRRINLPTGVIDKNTVATSEYTVPTRIVTGEWIQRGVIVQGVNVLAMELHRFKDNEPSNSFDGSALFILDGMYMVLEGAGYSLPAGEGETQADKAFDNNSETHLEVASSSCEDVIVEWNWNNERREVITSYGVVNARGCNRYTPSGWNLLGSNDGDHWNLLHKRENILFTEYNQQKRFDFYNEKAYNMYRFVSTQCINTAIETSEVCTTDKAFQLAELYLFVKRLDGYCPGEGEYLPAMNGDSSYQSCPQYYQGLRERVCTDGILQPEINRCIPEVPAGIMYEKDYYQFYQNHEITPLTPSIVGAEYTVSTFPSLPDGLMINKNSGIISGTPTTLSQRKSYSVLVTNPSGVISTNLYLEVIKAPINWWLISLFIVIAIVIVVAIVIIVIVMKKKSSKKNITAAKPIKPSVKI